MKRFLVGAIVCLAFAASAAAQQSAANTPATKQDVEKLLQVMQMHQTMQRMAEAMSKPMHRMVHEQYLKEEKQCKFPPDFEARVDKIMDESMKQMPMDQMLQAVVPVYQKHFTEADIDALIAFYSGPTGQKFMREMPAISAETMQATMPLMLKYNRELSKRIADEFARAKKESKDKSCPGTSAEKQQKQ